MFSNLLKIVPAIPELFLSLSTLLSLLVGTFWRKKSIRFALSVAIFSLIMLVIVFFAADKSEQFFWNGLFINKYFSVYAKICLYFISAVAIFCLFSFADHYGLKKFEWLLLAMFTIIGGSVAISSNHFLTLFMGLEISHLSQYLLVAGNRNVTNSSEGATKFFILGAISTAFILFGISLIYGFTGTNMFNSLFYFFGSNVHNFAHSGAIVGMLFVIMGLCFKLPTAPFHTWAPDVYQSAPLPILLFIGTVPKLITIFSLLHLLTYPFYEMFTYWRYLFVGIAIVSMIWGAFAALKQTNLMRVFAYSTVMNMGFLLIGTAMGGAMGLKASLIYGVFYVLTMIGIFALLIIFERTFHPIKNISDLSGIMSNSPMLGGLFVLLILSAAGIPPLPGFFAKVYILISAVNRSAYGITIVAVIATVISAAYYLNILKSFVLGSVSLQSNSNNLLRKYMVKIIIVVLFFGLLLINIFPVDLLQISQNMVVSALFD